MAADEVLERLEEFDGHAPLRNVLRAIATEKDEWAGIPMPLGTQTLVIEPTYPYAALAEIGRRALYPGDVEPAVPDPASDDDQRYRVRNRFWSFPRRAWVVIWDDRKTGRVNWGLQHSIHSLDEQLMTLGSSDAWGIEQESKALDLLATLVRHRAFKQYLLTGMFLETSKRSGICYLFRRLRPTVAITPRRPNRPCSLPSVAPVERRLGILAALCLHPIGYYSGSWAGSLCPTDDVIAHLMLMRGDEPMLWRRANQHPPYTAAAGL